MHTQVAARPAGLSPAQRRLFTLHAFLAELEPADRQRVLWCSPVVGGRPGQVLLDVGEPCVGLLLLDEGSVRMTTAAGSLVDRVRPGEVDATAAGCLLTGEPSPVRVTVGRRTSGVLLPAGLFASLLVTSSTFRCAVLESVGTAVVRRTAAV